MADWGTLFARGAQREFRVVFSTGDFSATFDQDAIVSGGVQKDLFQGGKLSAGGTVAKICNLSIIDPLDNGEETIPRACPFWIYVRLTDGEDVTPWHPLGRFYLDTRERSATMPAVLNITGYDAMLIGEQPYYPIGSTITGWPKLDLDVIHEICDRIGVELDQNTEAMLDMAFMIPTPNAGEGGFTVREVLSQIGKMYGGNWYIDGYDYLCLSVVSDIPTQGASFLADGDGNVIKMGGVRIIV